MRTLRKFHHRIKVLFSYKFFWIMTLLGLFFMFAGSLAIYQLESHLQPQKEILDYLVWTVGLVTTVGYGEVQVQTTAGKFIVMGLMLFGSLYLWSYMAFLVTALIDPEIANISREMHEVEHEIASMKSQLKK